MEVTLKCQKCGAEYTISVSEGNYKKGKYRKHCSRSCANGRVHSDLTKRKISESVKKYYETTAYPAGFSNHGPLKVYHCKNCNKGFTIIDKRDTTGYKYCSNKCREEFFKAYIKPKSGGKRKGSGIGKKGWYKGIYCDSTWELAFVIYCLEHNIPIKRNKSYRTYLFNGEKHKYYPDFIVEETKVYEIKGYCSEQWKAKCEQNPDIIVIGKDKITKYLKYCINKYGIEFWEDLYEDNPNNNIEHLKATRKFLWLNNGSENVFITPDKYDEYIKAGYVRGRIS